jgi:hypothetical protein
LRLGEHAFILGIGRPLRVAGGFKSGNVESVRKVHFYCNPIISARCHKKSFSLALAKPQDFFAPTRSKLWNFVTKATFQPASWENISMSDAIFSTSVKGGGKTYFFDVKQAQKGKQSKFIQISQTWLQDGQPHRSGITIFPEQMQGFIDAFKETAEKVN